MSQNQILAFSSSRVGNDEYLETAVPFIKEMLGDTMLQIAFIPFASVDNDFDDYTLKLKYYGLKTHRLNTLTESHLSVG